jgi:hypothetical protein
MHSEKPPHLLVPALTMSANPFFFTNVLTRANQDREDGDHLGSDMGDFDDPNADKVSTLLVDTQEDQVLDHDLGTQPSTDHVLDALIQAPALEQTDDHNQENGPITEDDVRTYPTLSEDVFDPSQPPPRGKFIAHHWIKSNRVVYCPLDIESGAEYLIQLSAELFHHSNDNPTSTE